MGLADERSAVLHSGSSIHDLQYHRSPERVQFCTNVDAGVWQVPPPRGWGDPPPGRFQRRGQTPRRQGRGGGPARDGIGTLKKPRKFDTGKNSAWRPSIIGTTFS